MLDKLYDVNIQKQLLEILQSIQHRKITFDLIVDELKKYDDTFEMFKLLCDIYFCFFYGAEIVDLTEKYGPATIIDDDDYIFKIFKKHTSFDREYTLIDGEEIGLHDEFAIEYYYNKEKETYKAYYHFQDYENASVYYNFTINFINNKFINELIGITPLEICCANYLKTHPNLIKNEYLNRDLKKLIST